MTEKTTQDHLDELNGAILRAARNLRNTTQNLVLLEDAGPDARDAWKALDEAIIAKDSFVEACASKGP